MKHEESITLGGAPEAAPLVVARIIDDEHGSSHIEPELGQDWPDIDKLRWDAGVLMVDEGIEVRIREISPGKFALSGTTRRGGWGMSSRDFYDAWYYLSALAHGARLARELDRQP